MIVGHTQFERVMYEIEHRAEVPQLDFTQQELDNGDTISTRERVIKEVRPTISHCYMRGLMRIVSVGIGATTHDDHSDR